MYEEDKDENSIEEESAQQVEFSEEEQYVEPPKKGGVLFGMMIGTVVGLAFLGAMLVFFKPGAIAKIQTQTPWAQSAATQPQGTAGTGGCGSGGGCGSKAGCGGGAAGCGGSGGEASPALIENIKTTINQYYGDKLGTAFTVEVKDFGCHQEAYVLIDGKAVKKLSISGSRISEVPLEG